MRATLIVEVDVGTTVFKISHHTWRITSMYAQELPMDHCSLSAAYISVKWLVPNIDYLFHDAFKV